MNNNILIKNLIKNTEIIYGKNLNVELVKLSILYSVKYKKLCVFGEIRGEQNDYGLDITTIFITEDNEYISEDKSDSLFATFPGIQSFYCDLNLEDALIKCQKLKVRIERKFLYARDRNRSN